MSGRRVTLSFHTDCVTAGNDMILTSNLQCVLYRGGCGNVFCFDLVEMLGSYVKLGNVGYLLAWREGKWGEAWMLFGWGIT